MALCARIGMAGQHEVRALASFTNLSSTNIWLLPIAAEYYPPSEKNRKKSKKPKKPGKKKKTPLSPGSEGEVP